MLQYIFKHNGILFWMLGISVGVLSIIYGTHAELFRDYKNEWPWNKEFIEKQILLEKLSNEKGSVRSNVIRLIDLDAKNEKKNIVPLYPPKTKTSDGKKLGEKTIIVVDKTYSVEKDLTNVIYDSISVSNFLNKISNDLVAKDFLPNNNLIQNSENNANKLSAASVFAISFINALINKNKHKKNRNKFAIAFYYTDNKLEIFDTNNFISGNIIWHKYSDYITSRSIASLVDAIIEADSNLVPSNEQITDFPILFRNIRKKVLGELANNDEYAYHIIIISDFIDDNIYSDDMKRNSEYETNKKLRKYF